MEKEKPISITLVGKGGRIGKVLSALILEDPELKLDQDGEIVIDFSSPEGTKKAISLQKPLVCGTTGLSDDTMQELIHLARLVPVIYSPNFSIGITLCFEILAFLKDKQKFFTNVTIQESHHKNKKDTPSGTALKMGEIMDCKKILSQRTAEEVGKHEIDFFLANEKISLRHEASSREAFAHGAILAAKYIYNREPKFYNFSDCLVDNKIGIKHNYLKNARD